MRRQLHSTLVATALLTLACGNDLSRSKAKVLIEQSSQFNPSVASVDIPRDGAECGVGEGLWYFKRDRFYLTKLGAADFQGYPGYTFLFYPAWDRLKLVKPVKRRVTEITGVRKVNQGESEVLFTWEWEWSDWPERVRKCIPKPPPTEGEASLRLYDDGWRIERVGKRI